MEAACKTNGVLVRYRLTMFPSRNLHQHAAYILREASEALLLPRCGTNMAPSTCPVAFTAS